MATLGELEQRVMDVLWAADGPMSVRQVLEVLLDEKRLAYTTVMTVLDRLAKKDVVSREREWMYTPARDRASLVVDHIETLVGTDAETRRAVFAELVQRYPELELNGAATGAE